MKKIWVNENEMNRNDVANKICSFYQRFLWRIKKENEDAKISQVVIYTLKLNRHYYNSSRDFIEYASYVWKLNDKMRNMCKTHNYKEIRKQLGSVYGFITNRLKEKGFHQNDLYLEE